MSFNALLLCAVSLVFMVMFKILSVIDVGHDTYYIWASIIFIIIFSWSLVFYIRVRNRISDLIKKNSNNKLIIEDGFVELDVNGTNHRIESTDIQYIIINKYSISFVSGDNMVLGIEISYMDEIMDAISDDMQIVDNSGLY